MSPIIFFIPLVFLTNSSVSIGESSFFSIEVEPESYNISGIQSNIQYDPSFISIIRISEGDLFKIYNTFYNSGTNDPSNNIIKNNFNVIIGNYSSNSSGSLSTIQFKPIKEGTTYLYLSNVKIADINSDPVPFDLKNSSITILPEKQKSSSGGDYSYYSKIYNKKSSFSNPIISANPHQSSYLENLSINSNQSSYYNSNSKNSLNLLLLSSIFLLFVLLYKFHRQ